MHLAAHVQQDPSHPDHEVCRENLAVLRAARDARGRALEVVEVPAPTVLEAAGELVDYSYINHYVCNGAVIMPQFGDAAADAAAKATLQGLFPGRAIEQLNIDGVAAGGGGIHCATQQEPRG